MTDQDVDIAQVVHLKKTLRAAHMALALGLKAEYGHMVIDPIREAIHQLHLAIAAVEGDC